MIYMEGSELSAEQQAILNRAVQRQQTRTDGSASTYSNAHVEATVGRQDQQPPTVDVKGTVASSAKSGLLNRLRGNQ